jgi:hypothetical protein
MGIFGMEDLAKLSNCNSRENWPSESHADGRELTSVLTFGIWCPIWVKLGVKKPVHNAVGYLRVS